MPATDACLRKPACFERDVAADLPVDLGSLGDKPVARVTFPLDNEDRVRDLVEPWSVDARFIAGVGGVSQITVTSLVTIFRVDVALAGVVEGAPARPRIVPTAR